MPEVFDYFLTFGNCPVGDSIHAIASPSVKLMEQPKQIHGFRRKDVLLDNRYPAVVYEYPFIVYTTGNSVVGFLYDFYKFNWLWDLNSTGPSSGRTLTIRNSSGTALASFGKCWFCDLELKQPDELLVHKAGLVGVKFMGSTLPTLP